MSTFPLAYIDSLQTTFAYAPLCNSITIQRNPAHENHYNKYFESKETPKKEEPLLHIIKTKLMLHGGATASLYCSAMKSRIQ